MCDHVPRCLHKYLPQQTKEPSERAIILIPLSKKQGTLQNGRHFHEFARENAREPAWKIITKGIYRYLSNYSKSPCYGRDKTVHILLQMSYEFGKTRNLIHFGFARDVSWATRIRTL